MAVDKNTIIPVLVFACGILAGIVLTGALSPRQAHPVKQVVSSDKAPQPIGPYSQEVVSGTLVFLSGQVGIDPATAPLPVLPGSRQPGPWRTSVLSCRSPASPLLTWSRHGDLSHEHERLDNG